MQARRGTIARIVTLSLAAFVGFTTLAAEPPGSQPPSPPPGVIISGRTKTKLKHKPVRKALEARYATLSEAYLRGDPGAALRLRSADFHLITPSGEIWDAATSAQYTRETFADVETTLVATFGLGIVDVQGDTAAAEIDEHWVRREVRQGALREVDTNTHQRETWVSRDGEWLLWRVDQVVPDPWSAEGKLVHPAKPYEPKRAGF